MRQSPASLGVEQRRLEIRAAREVELATDGDAIGAGFREAWTVRYGCEGIGGLLDRDLILGLPASQAGGWPSQLAASKDSGYDLSRLPEVVDPECPQQTPRIPAKSAARS